MDAAIANKVIEFIFNATGRHSIICNKDGVIVAAKVTSRIGDVHHGARQMLREGLPHAMITPEEEKACCGRMKAGCNLPIWHNGELLGSIGITGDPERTEPLTRLASGLISKELRERDMYEETTRLHEQLHQAQKMESLGILAGGVAHDMNNALGAILGLASANLEIQPPGSPTFRAFDTISKAATRGGKLVQSLLAFARTSLVEERALNMNELLEEHAHILERSTQSKVRLVLDLDPALRDIRGDAGALAHAIMNLGINAVDAMPEGGTLTIRTRNVDPCSIEVRVEDTGCGMPAEVLEKAADPFFTTKEVGKGTGLGLSIVFRTIKFHHGQMEILSEPGRGTSVVMRFPALERLLNNMEPLAATEAEQTRPTLSVLLVDDDELIHSSMQSILDILGHALTGVHGGREALAKLDAGFEPDLVILDMNMPGMGGVETLPLIRERHPDLPVLLATGRVDQTALNLVETHPFVTLMAKPFTAKELKERFATIEGRRHRQELAT